MSLLTIHNLAKSYGPDDIFSHIHAAIPQRARIGLVGPNGVGKTTLLRILLGLEEPSEGEVQTARGLRLGYLPQEVGLVEISDQGSNTLTLWDACRSTFSSLITRQEELARLEAAMREPQPADSLLETYGRLQHEFEHLGGYTYELRIRQTLAGLGFSPADERRPISQLSGGQRTRAQLARLLLIQPDLVLLDEPTNHLDIAAIEWLENYLKDWPGAVLIVSHDRYFLDQVVSSIWEMTPAFEVYSGNYSSYLTQRGARYQYQLQEYENQQAFIEKESDYIRRNIAGQNTRQAQGRRKRLERLLEQERLAPPVHEPRRLHLKLEPVGRSGDLVIRTAGLSVGYADEGRPLFHVPDLVLQRQECAAVIGPNGAGKTTFLKTLLEQIPPYGGEAVLGASLQIGYFAQAHEGLHKERTLLEEIQNVTPKMLPGEIRSYLAKFLFTGDDVFKTVGLLSGGERGRLALACLALQGANLMLLDEPTNHLDLPSQEVLQSILADFHGTILLVSHDRYLIDALATQVWEVLPTELALRVFKGTYSEYKQALNGQIPFTSGEILLNVASPSINPAPQRASVEPGSAASSSQSKPPSKDQLRRRQLKITALEEKISRLETQLQQITSQLETPLADPIRIQRLGQEYVTLHQTLEELLEEWSRLAAD
jgi:ATP-binding cassette subfamily F protein 3